MCWITLCRISSIPSCWYFSGQIWTCNMIKCKKSIETVYIIHIYLKQTKVFFDSDRHSIAKFLTKKIIRFVNDLQPIWTFDKFIFNKMRFIFAFAFQFMYHSDFKWSKYPKAIIHQRIDFRLIIQIMKRKNHNNFNSDQERLHK